MDEIAATNHLLIPKRPFSTEDEMTPEEQQELREIKQVLAHEREYDFILENFPVRRSVMLRWHLHLVTAKDT